MAASRAAVPRRSLLLSLCAVACATTPPPPPPPRPARPVVPLDADALPEGALAEVPLRDGRTLTLRASGALERRRGDAVDARLEVPDPAGCALRPWGDRGLALCPEGAPARGTLFGPDSPWLAALRGPMAAVIPGSDGRSLTRNGPCEAGGEYDLSRESVACTWREGAGWRAWTVDRPDARVLDVFDQRALVRWVDRVELPERPPITHEVVGLYDIARARWIPLSPADPTARWVCAGFDGEGRVRALVHTGTPAAPRAWRLSSADAREETPRLQARPLPFAAEDFGALDDLRMVLVRGAEVVAMREAERAVPVRGGPAREAPPRREATRCGERVVCGADRCTVDGRVSVSLPAARDPLAP